MIVALAGGVGGAKLAQGLMLALSPGELTVVVNTADDFDLFGLRICPDLDTVLYTLAGIANPDTGWGIRGDTFVTLDALARYGREPWFRLGDQDFATHIARTERLRQGAALTAVMDELRTALGVPATILPMTDDDVATSVQIDDGLVDFQDYFVRRGQSDNVLGIAFSGIEAARPTPAVRSAFAAPEMVLFCPSNPLVSIGPILALPGMSDLISRSTAPVVAVSPIVGGRAIKGPADQMLAGLGHEVSALGVARMYAGLVHGMVIDEVDANQTAQIREELGMEVLVTGTIMGDAESRKRLAEEVIRFGRTLSRPGSERR